MKLIIKANIFDKKNALVHLKEQLKRNNFKRPLIICDQILSNNNYIKQNIKNIKTKFIQFNKEPSYELLDQEIKKIKKIRNLDCIVAIGGGSSIDFGKGIALLYKNKGPSLKYMGFPNKINTPLPVVAIPSTVSTGSEVIYNAVFTHEKGKKKLGINSDKNFPVLSILDTNLIKTAPYSLILQSAIASLVRSIETYTSVDANQLTKFFSIKSFELIINAFKEKNKSTKFYKNLQWGSIFSMFALSNSSSGPCGVINYYLSVNYKIPQALAYNFTAIEFFKQNISNGYKGYDKLLKETNLISNKSIKKNTFSNLLNKIIKKNIINIQKSKNKIKKDDNFEKKMLKTFKDLGIGVLKKNPINMNVKDLKDIIERIKK